MEQTTGREGRLSLISTFYLGDTLMGIDTLRVQEVVKVMDITRVYHAPEHILGIINLRGIIVTIIDLGVRLNLHHADRNEDSRIIIVEWKNEYVGFLVDQVSEVLTLDRDKIMPAPSNVRGIQGKFFEGVYNFEDHLIALLDVNRLFSDE